MLAIILFADDTTFCLTGQDYIQLIETANGEMLNFFTWTQANRLTINLEKTLILPITNYNIGVSATEILLKNLALQRANDPKFLGVTLVPNLNCNLHIKNICSKVSKSIRIIFKLQKTLTDISPHWSLLHSYIPPFNLLHPYMR